MSVTDKDGQEIIRLPGFWELMFKAAIALSVPVFLLGVSWAVWITTRTYDHDREIAVMQESLTDIKSRVHGVASQVGKLPGKIVNATRDAGGE